MYQLKPIKKESIPLALEKAERYRLLGEPWMAESICLDILDADAGNPKAIIVLLLANTDQFNASSMINVTQARHLLSQLPDEYSREYYAGIICERQAHSVLRTNNPEREYIAYEWLANAMDYYERAESVRPVENDDSILRWNTCVRLIQLHNLTPRTEKYVEQQLE
jgi:hypothetical protein